MYSCSYIHITWAPTWAWDSWAWALDASSTWFSSIPHAVLPLSWPIVPSENDLQGESSPSDVASTNAFMELCHDMGTLILTYTSEDRMSVAMTEQLSVHQSIPSCIPLDRLCFSGLFWEHTITKVAQIGRHLGLHYVDL